MTIPQLAAATICTLLTAIVSGCANSPPSDFFVLTPMTEATERPSGPPPGEAFSLGVGPVKIPEYLNRAQIVTRAGPNRLDVNEFNRWGGSFATNLASVVAQNLSAIIGTDDVFIFPADEAMDPRYRVVLSILRFDGALGESVVLDARWTITGPKRRRQLDTGRSVVRQPTNASTYEAYVAAQSQALETLSRELAAKIKLLLDKGE